MHLAPICLLMISSLAWGQEINNPNKLKPCPKPDYSKNTDFERFAKWTNCWGRYELSFEPKGDIYEGEFIAGEANGYGSYYFLADNQFKGEKYYGQWRSGRYHGQGTSILANSDKYVGEFVNGKRQGQGTLTMANGNKYVGSFDEGNYHGLGTYIFANGESYVGEWNKNKRNGQGINTLADGRKQEGLWENDILIRETKVSLPIPNTNSGEIIDRFTLPPCPKADFSKSADVGIGGKTGEWSNCWGTFENKGEVLEGEWRDGFLHGLGTYIFQNGNKYTGQFKGGKFHGTGTFFFLANNQWKGDKYVGEFKDDKGNGQGTYYYLADGQHKGDKYVGEYKDGKRNGPGTHYHLANNQWKGDKYEGQFKDDMRNGRGTYTFADGRKQESIWENGVLIREITENQTPEKNRLTTNKSDSDQGDARAKAASPKERRTVVKKSPAPPPPATAKQNGDFR